MELQYRQLKSRRIFIQPLFHVQPDACKVDYGTQPYLTAHYQLLSHAAAVQVYRQKYQESQQGVIGIVLNSNWFIPNSQAKHNRNSALRALDFMFGWYMDPVTQGDYPHSMRSLVGSHLPKFTRNQSTLLKGSYDFLCLNYYTSSYSAYAPNYKNVTPSYRTDSLVNLTCVGIIVTVIQMLAGLTFRFLNLCKYLLYGDISTKAAHILSKPEDAAIQLSEPGAIDLVETGFGATMERDI